MRYAMSVKQLNPVYDANVYNNTSALNINPQRPHPDPGWGDKLYVVVTSSVMKSRCRFSRNLTC